MQNIKNKNSIIPKVSILCLTYNQKKYIRQAIDSFLLQKTNFPFEVLINDDCSTDGTTEIIKEYAKKYPDIIKPIIQKENQYSQGKRSFFARFLIPKAQGEYLALCEGDDYWTDPLKLQRQVDFLDKNPSHAICFHPVKVVYENAKVEPIIFPSGLKSFSIKRLLQTNFIHTNSVMYRKQDYANVKYDLMPADWYLNLFHAQFGEIGYIDKVMAVYRKHSNSLWWVADKNPESFWNKYGLFHILFFTELDHMFGDKPTYAVIIKQQLTSAIDASIRYSRDKDALLSNIVQYNKASLSSFISRQNDRISQLEARQDSNEKSLDALNKLVKTKEKELQDIKNSKVWRFRNTTVKILGKKPVY